MRSIRPTQPSCPRRQVRPLFAPQTTSAPDTRKPRDLPRSPFIALSAWRTEAGDAANARFPDSRHRLLDYRAAKGNLATPRPWDTVMQKDQRVLSPAGPCGGASM